MKSIRTTPTVHAAEGDERIRTAVPAPGADPVYGIHGDVGGTGPQAGDGRLSRQTTPQPRAASAADPGQHRRFLPTGHSPQVSDRTGAA